MSKKTIIIWAVAAGLIVLGFLGFFGTEQIVEFINGPAK